MVSIVSLLNVLCCLMYSVSLGLCVANVIALLTFVVITLLLSVSAASAWGNANGTGLEGSHCHWSSAHSSHCSL
jgi:hypothetical protein